MQADIQGNTGSVSHPESKHRYEQASRVYKNRFSTSVSCALTFESSIDPIEI